MIGQCILLALLAVLTAEDVHTRKISARFLLLAGCMGMMIFLAIRPFSLPALLAGTGVGGLLLLVSALGKESVGAGDGWLFCVTGIFLGFEKNLALLMTSLLLAAGYALLLLIVKRCGKQKEFAFLPFVLAAYILQLTG